jgi:hypothetical protein
LSSVLPFAGWHWSAPTTIRFESEHEIKQNGIICLNLVEKILGRTVFEKHLGKFYHNYFSLEDGRLNFESLNSLDVGSCLTL